MEVGVLAWPEWSPPGSEQLIKTVAAAGTPEKISATSIRVRQATLIGNKAARTANTGTVYVGPGATDDTQIYSIASGEVGAVLQSPDGGLIDLSQWYVDAENNGDGVSVIYVR